MEQKTFFSATIGLYHPWKISDMVFSKDEKRLDITIDCDQDESFICPICGVAVELSDTADETWHHNNFFNYQTYLHARVPQIKCACCGISVMERPWSREGSRFVLVSRAEGNHDNCSCDSAAMS